MDSRRVRVWVWVQRKQYVEYSEALTRTRHLLEAGWQLSLVPLRPPSSSSGKHPYSSTMPPMAFTGTVSRVGFMHKTATVTVTRWTVHPRTKKVCRCISIHTIPYLTHIVLQRMEKRTKLLVHDDKNSMSYYIPLPSSLPLIP